MAQSTLNLYDVMNSMPKMWHVYCTCQCLTEPVGMTIVGESHWLLRWLPHVRNAMISKCSKAVNNNLKATSATRILRRYVSATYKDRFDCPSRANQDTPSTSVLKQIQSNARKSSETRWSRPWCYTRYSMPLLLG